MFKPTNAKSVKDYISQIDEPRKSEIKKIYNFIKKILPKLDIQLYNSVIGFGKYHYKTKSGSEGDWFRVGLASQKNYISIYVCALDEKKNGYLVEKHKDWFPKATIGKSCIGFKKIEDIDFKKLESLLKISEKAMPVGG